MIDFSTPLSGMTQAADRVNQAATRIGRAPATADDVVTVMQSRDDFTANTKVLKVGNEMTRATLDLMA
jgi:hypothetical protein